MSELVVLYGSETGNARELAEYLYRECVYRDLNVRLSDMNSVSLQHLQSRTIALFVCSTTGDGEEPKNMRLFWRQLLSRHLTPQTFSGLNFSVLGLGDSSYAKFNYTAKRLYRRLEGLGGTPLYTLGLSDEQHPEGADYQSYVWMGELFQKLGNHLQKQLSRSYRMLPPRYNFTISQEEKGGEAQVEREMIDEEVSKEVSKKGTCSKDSPFSSVMRDIRRVTSKEHFQDVRLVEFDIAGSGILYKPGDVVWIYPRNTEEDVVEAANLLNLNLDSTLEFTSAPPAPLPKSLTIRDLLREHLDIASIPSRVFFEICTNFATDELEKEKFEDFISLLGREELYSYVSRPRRTILEVLGDFHSVRANLDMRYLLDFIPLIRPRGFSIASAQCVDKDRLQICMAVVRYRTIMKKERIGLCSNYLANLPLNSCVKLFAEPGSFKFPTDRPIIMIGPGTGCAPFRSLIQSRAKTSQQLILFYGCRSEHHDYFFRSEWDQITNLQVITAFSRDQERKIYVQHRIVEHGALVWGALEQGAVFCVAGNSKNMPFQVKDALIRVSSEQGKLSKSESEKYVESLVRNRLYQTETW